VIAQQTDIMKIVIVDDSPLIVSRLRQQISGLPYIEISGVATNIAMALETVKLHGPDVVILDIYLKDDAPSSSGITLLAMLRQTYASLHIIMLTNLSGEPYNNRCMELGANYFLDKSVDFERIPEVLLDIRQLLNTSVL